jgi:hypothetical protein
MITDRIYKGILMSLAPPKPDWFIGENLLEEPVKPLYVIPEYAHNGVICTLLSSWISDPIWDLETSYELSDCPEGLDRILLEKALANFAKEWEQYWRAIRAWKVTISIQEDLQWRKYWANLVIKELDTDALT